MYAHFRDLLEPSVSSGLGNLRAHYLIWPSIWALGGLPLVQAPGLSVDVEDGICAAMSQTNSLLI